MNRFQLLQRAIYQRDLTEIRHLATGAALHYFIDVATEEGDVNTAKLLVQEFKAQPSLYAFQMAKINGHNGLIDWLDEHATLRNTVGIKNVHWHYNPSERKMVWSDFIPAEHRY